MRFVPKYAGLTVWVLDEHAVYNADGAKRVVPSNDGTRSGPAIFADFGEAALFGEEVAISDLDGNQSVAPDIRIGIYDTAEAQRPHGWTDFERAEVERTLLALCENNPNGVDMVARRNPEFGCVSLYSAPVPVPPWPTYDDTHHFKVAELAKQLGLEREALIYEQRTKARPSVLEALVEQETSGREVEQLVAAE